MLETKSIAQLEFDETPTRKRKRESLTSCKEVQQQNAAACFTNSAFSSTPNKITARRRIALPATVAAKENTNPFVQHSGLEVKSISDIVNNKKTTQTTVPTNPFEVLRKPPKKKKCEIACFENPALNIDLPERRFNPFEVVRVAATPTRCFVNEALNLRGNDAAATLNPYEIQRKASCKQQESPSVAGLENFAMTTEHVPTNLKIGLPFTPNVGYRIDFKGLPLSQLTPSKLLAEKLVFSPIPVQGKRSLDSIKEDTTMDIGKELDRYQLELENSINEAKTRKHGLEVVDKIEVEQRIVCTRTLTEISEADEEEQEETVEQKQEAEEQHVELKISATSEKIVLEKNVIETKSNPTVVEEETVKDSGDVAYASDDSEDEDLDTFKAPTRFVRAYRPAATTAAELVKETLKTSESKESLNSLKSNKSNKSEELKTRSSVKNLIRKSIRKIMHPTQSHQTKKTNEEEVQTTVPTEKEHETKEQNNIINSIRHSLRRRPQKTTAAAAESEPQQLDNDISIIDSSERVMKLKSSESQTEYMKIEQLTNEKKHTLRNSIKRSTRDVMRHVFHKHHQEAYTTQK